MGVNLREEVLKDDDRELLIQPYDNGWRATVTLYAMSDRVEMAHGSTPEEAVRNLGLKLTGLRL